MKITSRNNSSKKKGGKTAQLTTYHQSAATLKPQTKFAYFDPHKITVLKTLS